MQSILLIYVDASPSTGDVSLQEHCKAFCEALGFTPDALEVFQTSSGATLPTPSSDQLAIITGSPRLETVFQLRNADVCEWIRNAMEVGMPLFGVGYGHHLMAGAMGGRVGFNPRGREIGCLEVRLLPPAIYDVQLRHWPITFPAHAGHVLSILELPSDATALACSEIDPHQVVRYGPNAISTQFRPEFTTDLSKACIRASEHLIWQEGNSPKQLLAEVTATPEASLILKFFAECALMATLSIRELRTGQSS